MVTGGEQQLDIKPFACVLHRLPLMVAAQFSESGDR